MSDRENSTPYPLGDKETLTQTTMETFVYQWMIVDFKNCAKAARSRPWLERMTESSKFAALEHDRLTWRLRLRYEDLLDPSYMSVYLDFVSSTSELVAEFEMECTFSLLNAKRALVHSKLVTNKSCKVGTSLGVSRYIKLNYVLDKANNLLMDGRLTVVCTVKHRKAIDPSTPALPASYDSYKLSRDVGTLLKNQVLSDVRLVSSTGQEFRAHKTLLAARSPVFAAMFQHNVQESREGVVDMSDVSPELLAAMLEYVYTDQVPGLEEMTRELLALADKYDLRGLKIMCESSLSKGVDVNNALKLLALADLHNANALKRYVLKFIGTRPKEIVKGEEFEKFLTSLRQDTLPALIRKLVQQP